MPTVTTEFFGGDGGGAGGGTPFSGFGACVAAVGGAVALSFAATPAAGLAAFLATSGAAMGCLDANARADSRHSDNDNHGN